MNDKAMHQRMTVRYGVNYPFTTSLSNFTPKYAEFAAILQDNDSVEGLLKILQTSQWHFTISGMHFVERSVDKELDALFIALCTPISDEYKRSQKCKKKAKAIKSVKAPKPKKKLRFQRYKDSQIKGIEILKLYFFSKVAENAQSLLNGEDIWLEKGGYRIWPITKK
jgi:hypothetical protein